jgi:transcription factor IIIB subunit 2
LEEPLPSLTKTYNEVVKLFGFDLDISDPTIHLTALHTHLTRIISESGTFELPKPLASAVRTLQPRLSYVLRTAESLAALVTRSGKISHLATAPTACAIFLLALEGEIRFPLPNCGVLAQALGARFDVKQGVVMDRYRILYGIVEDWIKEVPWLRPSTQPRNRASSSRAKVTTRGAIAKGLNDVVQFQEEIWKKAQCGMEKFSLDLDLIDECDRTEEDRMTPTASLDDNRDDGSDFGSVASASPSVVTTASLVTKRKSLVSSREASVELTSTPIKKRKTRHNRSVESASQFLLDPSNTATTPSKSTEDNQLLCHLLSSDAPSLSHTFTHPPTRLQLLTAARHGGSDAIADEELFEEGELEAVFRNEEEVGVLVRLVDWDEVEEEKQLKKALKMSRNRSAKPEQNAIQEASTPQRETTRINGDAFKRLMDPTSDLDNFVVGCGGVDEESAPGSPGNEDDEGCCYHWIFDLATPTPDIDLRSPIAMTPTRLFPTQDLDAQLGGVEEEGEWRPMSPDRGMGLGLFDSTDYYNL